MGGVAYRPMKREWPIGLQAYEGGEANRPRKGEGHIGIWVIGLQAYEGGGAYRPRKVRTPIDLGSGSVL